MLYPLMHPNRPVRMLIVTARCLGIGINQQPTVTLHICSILQIVCISWLGLLSLGPWESRW